MTEDSRESMSAFERSKERLEEIVTQIRSKDVPLAQSLDLYEEAIALGTKCASLIDRTDFSAAELGLADSDDAQDDDGAEEEGSTAAAPDVSEGSSDDMGGEAEDPDVDVSGEQADEKGDGRAAADGDDAAGDDAGTADGDPAAVDTGGDPDVASSDASPESPSDQSDGAE